MKKYHTIRIVAVVLLLISLFCTIDLGMQFLYNLVPEFLDGYASHSILQGVFQVFGDQGWTLGKFFTAFEASAWITFVLFAANVMLHIGKNKK